MEMTRGIPRRKLHHLPFVSILVLISLIEFFFIFCELNVWVKKSRIKVKRSLKVFKKKILKSTWKLRVNENKQIEYTKKLMKGNPCWECMEAKDKCNSIFRTMEKNQAWWNMQCENRIPSQWHKWVWIWGSIQIHL